MKIHGEEISQQFFPVDLPGSTTGCIVDPDTAEKAIRVIGDQIFSTRESLGQFESPETRRRALEKAGKQHKPSSPEWVVFYNTVDEPVGWLYGYMEDEETFFIDTVGLIAAYRRRGIYTAFLNQLIAYLGALGYERLTTSHHPNNRAIMIAELKAGFNIVGLELHEGCGPLVKMAYLFHQDRQESFRGAFSMAPDPTADQ
jgi:RimJ/RimL family protein N-acetyltransferase